jgi:hypothetical protein
MNLCDQPAPLLNLTLSFQRSTLDSILTITQLFSH